MNRFASWFSVFRYVLAVVLIATALGAGWWAQNISQKSAQAQLGYELNNPYVQPRQLSLSVPQLTARVQQLLAYLAAMETPQVSAKSVLVAEVGTGRILSAQNIHTRHSPASLSKILTTLVAFDYASLDQEVVITGEVTQTVPSKVGFYEGETIRIQALLESMLIASANDGALAIAEAIGGSQENFVSLMNEKAKSLGMLDSYFSNPVGFDHANQYSSAHDLVILASEALRSQFVRNTIQTKGKHIFSVDGQFRHYIYNTNTLLHQREEVIGMKTGTTEDAGKNLILLVQKIPEQYVVILLGSEDRESDATIMVDWVLAQ